MMKIAVLRGDGIGPEVIDSALIVFDAITSKYGHQFELIDGKIGGIAIDEVGTPLPDDTVSVCEEVDAMLFGAVGGPKWDSVDFEIRPESAILSIRKKLDLFVNIRPVIVYDCLNAMSPLKDTILKNVELVILRELTGGLYFSEPKKRWVTQENIRYGVDTLEYSEVEIERILRVGFEIARSRRKKLTSVDKANVMESSKLWRQVANELASEYKDVQLEHLYMDNMAMQLITNPANYDVIVTENTFGDILSDEAAVISGSLGLLPSASLSIDGGFKSKNMTYKGLYEPIHGSAPDIVGKGIANPIATILSVAMMFRYSFGLVTEANTIEKAVRNVLVQGNRTQDIADNQSNLVSTLEMAESIVLEIASTDES